MKECLIVEGYNFQRYSLVPPTLGMEQRADGEWVKLDDALRLFAQNAILTAEIRELKHELREALSGNMLTLDSDGVQQTL